MATSTTTKKKGLGLHIGLNAVSPAHYAGWSGDLTACEFDAHDMADIAKARGITSSVLLTPSATRARVLASIRKAAKALKAGDFFLLSYSGHGGQIEDVTGEEQDKKDETWCLFDGELIDDELYLELSRFAKGVRILILSDSCHSGTVARATIRPLGPGQFGRSRMMPPAVAMRTYNAHKAFYDGLQRAVAKAAGGKVVDPDEALAAAHSAAGTSARLENIAAKCQASVILISGCQDNQTSMDGEHNGAFTEQLLAVWNSGRFKGTYSQFHQQIQANLPSSQSPNLFTLGRAAGFKRQQPFTV